MKLEIYKEGDFNALYGIFKEVVETGEQFPYKESTQEEFRLRFFAPGNTVYVCRSSEGGVIGGFFIKPNTKEGVANAAYMVHELYRGKGVGRWMVESSLRIAKEMGYRAMQYNMVMSKNDRAVQLYKNLGFKIVEENQKAYVMYKDLAK